MGQRFFNVSVPALIKQVQRTADAMEELIALLKDQKSEKENK